MEATLHFVLSSASRLHGLTPAPRKDTSWPAKTLTTYIRRFPDDALIRRAVPMIRSRNHPPNRRHGPIGSNPQQPQPHPAPLSQPRHCSNG